MGGGDAAVYGIVAPEFGVMNMEMYRWSLSLYVYDENNNKSDTEYCFSIEAETLEKAITKARKLLGIENDRLELLSSGRVHCTEITGEKEYTE